MCWLVPNSNGFASVKFATIPLKAGHSKIVGATPSVRPVDVSGASCTVAIWNAVNVEPSTLVTVML